MSQIVRAVFVSRTTDVTLTTTSETVVATVGPSPSPGDFRQIVVLAYAVVTSGAGTTAITPRIRYGSTTAGALVGEATAISATAGATAVVVKSVTDSSTVSQIGEYSLTLQQTAATANGTVTEALIMTMYV